MIDRSNEKISLHDLTTGNHPTIYLLAETYEMKNLLVTATHWPLCSILPRTPAYPISRSPTLPISHEKLEYRNWVNLYAHHSLFLCVGNFLLFLP